MGEPISPNSFLDTTRLHRWLPYVRAFGAKTTGLKRHAGGELERAWAARAEHAPGRAHRLSKTRRTRRRGIRRITTVGHQHITKPRIVHIRESQHVLHVEEIDHLRNRLDRKSFTNFESLRHAQIER